MALPLRFSAAPDAFRWAFKMKIMNMIISVGVAFILGAGAGWIAKGKHLDYLFLNYIPALVTLLAAFYGAKFAFDFQRGKEEEEHKNQKIVSGNLAIFKLTTMINSLLIYQRQIVEPVRGKPTAFLEMSPTLPQIKDQVSIDLDSLSFLLVTDDQNLIGELSVEEARYEAAIAAINERSRVHRNELQPALEAAGIQNGGIYYQADIQRALGERLFQTMIQSTDQVIFHVDATILSLKAVADKLTEALKKQFPKERIIRVGIPTDVESETGSYRDEA